MRKGFEVTEEGQMSVALENIWDRVRRWARRNGKEVVDTYGVVDVAPI